ncbi:MAG: SH3 domain-containing protein [Anaerolineae bacterium]|nr:SH3 domain-containing protein [Anaerolineae bacterium]
MTRLALKTAPLLLIALLIITIVAATLPVTVTAQEPDAYVNVASVNLRSAPNNRSTVLAQLPSNTPLTVTGRDELIAWVFVQTQSGQQGWVLAQNLLFRARFSLSALPVVDTVVGGAPAPTTAPAPDAGGGGDASVPATAVPAVDNPAPIVSGSVSGGFELGGQVAFLSGNTVNAMRTAGMRWVKRQAREGDGGAFGMIGEAHANGFKILLSVIGNKDAVTDEGYQNTYAGFVGQLAAAGADAIEVWNEMNIDREWRTGSIDPALYVQLLAKSYNAIKSNNRGTIVITGAPAPTGAEGAFGLDHVWNDDRYMAGMAAAGAGRYADCIGVHYNEGIVSPNQASGDPRDNYPTRYFSSMLNRALRGFGGKKACFTELGYLTGEGYGPLPGGFAWAGNVTVAQQAAWLAQAAVRASATGRVRLMIVFNVDFTHYGEDPQAGFAIIRPGGGCPACDSLGRVMR